MTVVQTSTKALILASPSASARFASAFRELYCTPARNRSRAPPALMWLDAHEPARRQLLVRNHDSHGLTGWAEHPERTSRFNLNIHLDLHAAADPVRAELVRITTQKLLTKQGH